MENITTILKLVEQKLLMYGHLRRIEEGRIPKGEQEPQRGAPENCINFVEEDMNNYVEDMAFMQKTLKIDINGVDIGITGSNKNE